MKTTFQTFVTLFCASATLLLGASVARCDDNTKATSHRHKAAQKVPATLAIKDDRKTQEVQGGTIGGANGPEYRVRTGSHIPEHYNRRGYSTDSRDNEFIYDHNDIRMQNSNTVSESLRQVPGVTVGGRP